jgi:hypothetical protein
LIAGRLPAAAGPAGQKEQKHKKNRSKMPRYFFDVISDTGTAHDHQGRDFNCPDGAKRQGELIAIDLRFAPDAEGRTGDKVAVCDVRGTVLFSIPVPLEV